MRRILLTTLAFSALAAAAHAAAPATDGEAVTQRKIALEAARMTTPGGGLRFASQAPTRIPGIAQTSLTSRFSPREAADAGLLCGLQPHPDTSGAAAAFGHDPDGKFVGAKLRLSF